MRVFSIIMLIISFFVSCSTVKHSANKKALAKVRKVAIVVYNIPNSIEFKDDPRTNELNTTYMSFADTISAANKGMYHFIKNLNKRRPGFKLMSKKQMLDNVDYYDLYRPTELKKSSTLLSFFASNNMIPGIAPAEISSFGMYKDWDDDGPLIGTKEEKDYFEASFHALKLDAIIIIADSGYSLYCENCLGGNGRVTTGGAFSAVMLNKAGEEIFRTTDFFRSSGKYVPMVSGEIKTKDYDNLFRAHGKKMAVMFSNLYKKALSK